MGVEYTHLLMVADLDWLPQPSQMACVERLVGCLGKWLKIRPDDFKSYDYAQGKQQPLKIETKELVLEAEMIEGPLVAQVMGHYYEPSPIVCSKCRLAPAPFGMDSTYYRIGVMEAYPGQCKCGGRILPGIKGIWHVSHRPQQPAFPGLWRSGLILDCGKDLPAFCTGDRVLPNQEFVKEVESAFGTRLNQLGYHY